MTIFRNKLIHVETFEIILFRLYHRSVLIMCDKNSVLVAATPLIIIQNGNSYDIQK